MSASHEPLRLLTLNQAITLVHEYKGVAAVAHPWLCSDPLGVCAEAVKCGVDGMECFPPPQNTTIGTETLVRFASEKGLFRSSGSDYHAIEAMNIEPGDNVFPEEQAKCFIESMKKHGIV